MKLWENVRPGGDYLHLQQLLWGPSLSPFEKLHVYLGSSVPFKAGRSS